MGDCSDSVTAGREMPSTVKSPRAERWILRICVKGTHSPLSMSDRSRDQSAVDAALRGEYELMDSVGAGACGGRALGSENGGHHHATPLLPPAGTFSVVYRARHRPSGAVIALKKIHDCSLPDRVAREVEYLRLLRCAGSSLVPPAARAPQPSYRRAAPQR